MKTEALDPRTMDDLIFENRNKVYGAYLIRKSYSQNMMAGLGISVSLACLLVILPNVLALFGDEPGILPTLKEPLDGIVVNIAPIIDVPVKVNPPPSAPKSTNTNLPPQVTTKPVEDVTPPTVDVTPSHGPGDGIDGAEPSPFGGGTGTDIIEAPLYVAPPPVVDFAEVMPQYEGGIEAMMKYIVKHTHFPSSARRLGTQGTVFVSFVVNSEGKVVDVRIARGISADCDKEAVRVISAMPAWKAGMQNHRAVSVRMTLPIKFQLQEI